MSLVTSNDLKTALGIVGTAQDAALTETAAAAEEALTPLLTPVDHSAHAACRTAALQVAQQVWVARQSPGGQMVGTDLGPVTTPFLLGQGLMTRLHGLLKSTGCWNVNGLVG